MALILATLRPAASLVHPATGPVASGTRRVSSLTLRHGYPGLGAPCSISRLPSSSRLLSSIDRDPASTPPSPSLDESLRSQTGGLRRLPVLRPSNELISTATKRVYKTIREDRTIKNGRQRARKLGAEKMDLLMKELCAPLKDTVQGYKRELRRLHPFEKVVADLTARAREKRDGVDLHYVLESINEARKKVLAAGKGHAVAIKQAGTASDAISMCDNLSEALVSLYKAEAAYPIDNLLELQKSLRNVPSVKLDTPAVVLVGAPNVGKSSIVRAISSATPEVNNYPFTTRGMTIGHVETTWDSGHTELCQVMDSPGLLLRGESDRNEMEKLTVAAMQHLPTAVMYVLDLSGQAGDACSSVADQLEIRRQTRERFPRRPWIDVIAKADLGVDEDAREELYRMTTDGGDSVVEISVNLGQGVEELEKRVYGVLGQVRSVLDVLEAKDA